MRACELHKGEPILWFLAPAGADTPSFCQPAESALHDPTMGWMFFIIWERLWQRFASALASIEADQSSHDLLPYTLLLPGLESLGQHAARNTKPVSVYGFPLATSQSEMVIHAAYRPGQEAMSDIVFYIEGFYNRTRRHSALAFLSPANFDAAFARQPVFETFEFVSSSPG